MSKVIFPGKPLAALAVLAAALFAVTGCEERPSASSDTGDEQQTEQTGAIENPAPAGQTATDRDPTPQTGRGGAIPETDEGASQ